MTSEHAHTYIYIRLVQLCTAGFPLEKIFIKSSINLNYFYIAVYSQFYLFRVDIILTINHDIGIREKPALRMKQVHIQENDLCFELLRFFFVTQPATRMCCKSKIRFHIYKHVAYIGHVYYFERVGKKQTVLKTKQYNRLLNFGRRSRLFRNFVITVTVTLFEKNVSTAYYKHPCSVFVRV